MGLPDLIRVLGDEIRDPEEESFLLFSQALPSQDLGFADSKAQILEFDVGGQNVTIHQSPTLLASNRSGGTTGAVLWRISPLFAAWITSPQNALFREEVLGPTSTVMELGCGISGIVALSLAGRVGKYIATDQEYLLKVLKQNIDENLAELQPSKSKRATAKRKVRAEKNSNFRAKVEVIALDWELSSLSSLPSLLGDSGAVDAVIACDCIYNEALIEPLVRTCADICRLKAAMNSKTPTICIVAQQLRSSDVFEAWAKAFSRPFSFWRLPDVLLSGELRSDSGYVVHLGILRETPSVESP